MAIQNPNIKYRLLTVEDMDNFLPLRIRACREEPAAFLETPEEIGNKKLEECTKYFENGWIAGAFIDNKLVGNAGLFRHKGKKVEHKGTVWGVYVAPEARGNGIARVCIEMVLDKAKQAALEQVLITTDVTNAITVELYKNIGFEPWGVEKHITKLPDRYIDDVVMTKFL